jgi:hypothetical protein
VPDTPATEHPSPLALGLAAPDSVVYPLFEGVPEALLGDRAFGTDPLGRLDADAVTRKENARGEVFALPYAHPIRVHGSSIDFEEAAVGCEPLMPPPSVAQLVSHSELSCRVE